MPPPQRGRGRGYQDDRQGGGGGQRGGGGRGRGYQDDRQGGGGQWGGGGRGRGYQDDRQGGGGRGGGYQGDRGGQRGGGGGYRGRGAPRGRQDRGGYGQSRGGYGDGGGRYAAQSSQRWNPFPEGPGSHPKREKLKYRGADLGIEFKMSMKDPIMPVKQPPGKLGQKIKLLSNCFAMKAPSGYVYHYDVEVCNNNHQSTTTGKETAKSKKYVCLNTKRNREVINKLLSTNPLFEGAYGAYDGKKNLLCRSRLNIVGEEPLKCAVRVPRRDSVPVPGTDQEMDEFEVVLKPVRKKESNDCAINLDSLHAVYADVLKSPPEDAVMALETILRHGPCMRFTPVGRSFFYPPLDTDLHPLGGGMEIWFGYHQSVRLGEWSPIVNLNVSSTAFHQAKPMIDLIADALEVDPQGLHNMGALRDYQRKMIDKKYRHMQIEVTHLRYPRKYKYLKLTQMPANRLDFPLEENGVEVRKTVQQFFRERHNMELKYPHLPCIQVLPEIKRNYLPIEVCRLAKGQHFKGKLNPEQTAEMIKFAARPPSQRFHEIKDIREKRADYEQDPLVNGFEMSVYNEPLQLEGRVLDVPGVLYRDRQGQKKITPANGAWNMQGTRYIRGAEIGSWVLYNFSNSRFCNNDVLKMFATTLVDVASGEGIDIKRAETIQTFNPHQTSMVDILGNAKKKFNADLAILVLPGGKAKDSIYKDIKQAAETVVGLVTQCIIDKNLTDRKDKNKCSLQLVSNLCQKINAKMGGVNNSLISGEMPAIFREPVMIIGADVTHTSPGSDLQDGISIAAVVASLDMHPSRYAVSIRAQKHRDENKESLEIIVELDKMVQELLLAFYNHTKQKKPRRIVFYRDGVSEGQFNKVREKEISAVRRACKAVQNDGYEPPITFIVVQKRHHTRFMPSDERDGSGRMKNIPPGTTIDTVVTHPLYFDFFQCSHTGIQGTSKPCHYTVLHDDNKFTADDLQKLTFYLCHTYARCTRSIACPPPVMYADLAAYRAGKYLSEEEGSSSGSSVGGASKSSKQSKSSQKSSEKLLAKVQQEIKTIPILADTMYFV